jgi:hypothetical protein
MAGEDKPFVCIKRGWAMQIIPRNAAGWRALAAWMLALAPIAGLYIWALSDDPGTEDVVVATVLYSVVMAIWAIAMIRWTKARSEVIDLNELIAWKKERDEARKRGRR